MKGFRYCLAAIFLAASLSTSSAAQVPVQRDYPSSKSKPGVLAPHGDHEFVTKASQGGLLEVEVGKLASEKAVGAACKELGERLVKDHQEANEKLNLIANKKGIKVPSDLSGEHQNKVQKLNAKSGPDFDRAFIDMMIKDHQQDIALFEREAKTGSDSELKNFAQETLPTLREHLQAAQAAKAKPKS